MPFEKQTMHVPMMPPNIGMTYDKNTPINEHNEKKAYVLSDILLNTCVL